MTLSGFTEFLLIYAVCVTITAPQMFLMHRLGRRHELGFPVLLVSSTAAGCGFLLLTLFVDSSWMTFAGAVLVIPALTFAVTVLFAMAVGSFIAIFLASSRAMAKHFR